MDRFQVERPCVMKKYLPIKGLLFTTNIPEKTHTTSRTFDHSDNSHNLTLYYASVRAKFESTQILGAT